MSAAAAPAAAAAAARAHRVVQSVMPVICMVDPPSICPARPALMSVLVSQAWREANSLRPEELYEATRRATCHDPRNMHEVACSVCSHAKAVGKVVTIANFDKLQRVDGNTGTERYLFEIHALCASSRCHLGYAKVVLAMQYGPLCVNSNAFQLIGRGACPLTSPASDAPPTRAGVEKEGQVKHTVTFAPVVQIHVYRGKLRKHRLRTCTLG
eukprot:TRINITY_DN3963_c0_g1_i1.p1 TRINITY_DN3963_c0_g1~~TRINITY_DN3963_c0_g1_i1.p1  ORF type:complete len:212 (-),score=31.27 TRINITY_DN3963_c0_g1_i1:489-1124(-)